MGNSTLVRNYHHVLLIAFKLAITIHKQNVINGFLKLKFFERILIFTNSRHLYTDKNIKRAVTNTKKLQQ